jgi:hypothetical protein
MAAIVWIGVAAMAVRIGWFAAEAALKAAPAYSALIWRFLRKHWLSITSIAAFAGIVAMANCLLNYAAAKQAQEERVRKQWAWDHETLAEAIKRTAEEAKKRTALPGKYGGWNCSNY